MEEQKSLSQIDQEIELNADRIEKAYQVEQKVKAQEEDAYDGFNNEVVKLIPSPNFTDCQPLGTLLPINMANETVANLSRYAAEFNITDFIREKLGYSSKIKVAKSFSSEQVDALLLAIKSFEKGNAFILGDMAGIGKGRVCAGVMRYAYMRGLIPIFISQKSYLFNDIYRDLLDIDGLGSSDRQDMIMPKPFILHKEGVIIEPKGITPVATAQAIKTTTIGNQSTYVYVDTAKPNAINTICNDVINKIEAGGELKLPKEFNCVMLPYSILSSGKLQIKRNFLKKIAPNAIFIFDECHNAASSNENANILKHSLNLVELSKGVLFSSATYAKNPNVFNLYVVKTSLSTAVPSLEAINDALKVGGENVSEYIASGLVKEGEMIRRERSFSNCLKVTEYVGTVRSINTDGETIYADIPFDKQKEFFDEAIGYFKLLRDFTRTPKSKDAIEKAVIRKAEELNFELAERFTFQKEGRGGRNQEKQQEDWIALNRNKYYPIYKADSITRYKATFRENIFLALKGKFAADKIIECLNTQVEYTNVDGTTHFAPMKPLIAIANTGESIFQELQLKQGDLIANDISEYLRAIYRKLFVGKVTFRRIDNNFFESKKDLAASGIEIDETDAQYEVLNEDFSDNGEEIQEIQSALDAYKTSIPFSIIDYLRDRIESTPRSDVYFSDFEKITPKYGKSNSPFYKFQEGTSREYMLVKKGDLWEYTRNNRIRSTSALFRGFNDGVFDVMLINVVASTGGSAHSSPKEGMDTRPRNMFVIQFELDINVEVQKRGRINRTGQLNFPTYTYVITKVPVELRKYLMLRKKLRRLDANTSADQTASSKTAEITDSQGRPIEDIFNAYGYDVFIRSFLGEPNNIAYEAVFRELDFRESTNLSGEAEVENANVERFNAYIRELELYSCDFQEVFFEQMNTLYLVKKAELISNNEYQEELRPINYKASLKQRVVRQLNSGTTIFSLPLFIADYYTLETKKPLSNTRINQLINDLANIDGRSVSPEEHWRYIINDFRQLQEPFITNYRNEYKAANEPKRRDYSTREEFDEAKESFNVRLSVKVSEMRDKQNTLLEKILYYKPNSVVKIKEGEIKRIIGKFIGYRIKSTTSRFKYTWGSVEFIFCFLEKYPLITLNLSSDNATLDKIYPINNEIDAQAVRVAELWEPDLYRRIIRRFYTGNILSGIVQAQNDKNDYEKGIRSDNAITDFFLSRFTNIDGTITTAVEIKTRFSLSELNKISVRSQPLSIDAGSEFFLRYGEQLPIWNASFIPVWNISNERLNDRAICVLKRVNIGTIYLQFEIIQSAVDSKEKGTNRQVFKSRKEGESMYNYLYHDNELINRYSNYLTVENTSWKKIEYCILEWNEYDEDTRKYKTKTKYNKLYVHKKILTFSLDDSDAMEQMSAFLNDIQTSYAAAFSFRGGTSDYLNISESDDVLREQYATENEVRSKYPKGEYEYKFLRTVNDSVYQQIPNKISRKNIGLYGGVVLSEPIEPNRLPSYQLIPFKIPNLILIKLALSVLDAQQKEDFIREVGILAETKTDMEVGNYVRQFLTSRSVQIEYFFGSLRGSEYGRLFKDNALDLDVENITFESTLDDEGEVVVVRDKKNVVEMADAEDYLLTLLQLI